MVNQEEELKKVDLKVSINCCDGCRRKVLKALSIKGVLKTEIHPTLSKITVTGNVDTSTLIKKLARIGKSAEAELILPVEETEANQENEVVEEKSERVETISKERNADHNRKAKSKSRQRTTISNLTNAQESNKVIMDIGNEGTTVQEDTNNLYDYHTVVTDIPQVNHLVNPNAMPPYVQGYYSMMSTNPVPYYAMTMPMAPPPVWTHNHDQSQSMMYHPQQVQSQPQQSMEFTNYFNDENTLGCNVM